MALPERPGVLTESLHSVGDDCSVGPSTWSSKLTEQSKVLSTGGACHRVSYAERSMDPLNSPVMCSLYLDFRNAQGRQVQFCRPYRSGFLVIIFSFIYFVFFFYFL